MQWRWVPAACVAGTRAGCAARRSLAGCRAVHLGQPVAHSPAPYVAIPPTHPLPRLPPPADYFTACLAWLEAGGRVDAQPLAHQLAVPGFNLSALTPDRKFPPPPPQPAADEDDQPQARAQQLEAPASDAKPRRRPQSL